MTPERMAEVVTNVFLAHGTDVNWVVLREGTDLTLIDTGYPGDFVRLEESLWSLGRRLADVRAVLLTHAHVDHIGGAARLHDRYGAAVYTDAREAQHARREFLEQASPLAVAKNIWRPGVAPWLARVMRVGVMSRAGVPSAEPFPHAGPLDVPGRPVPVPTRGHTSGHTAYYLPQAGAVATGDELVTWHAVTRHRGPHVLPPFFSHGDSAQALTVLESLDADVILPGHGQVLRRPIKDAVAQARSRG